MFRIISLTSKCAVFVLAAHLFSTPSSAQHLNGSSTSLILTGAKSHGFHKHGRPHVHRHFIVPKAKPHVSKRPHYKGKPVKSYRHHGLKRHKFGYYPYKPLKRHGLKIRKYKYGFKYKKY